MQFSCVDFLVLGLLVLWILLCLFVSVLIYGLWVEFFCSWYFSCTVWGGEFCTLSCLVFSVFVCLSGLCYFVFSYLVELNCLLPVYDWWCMV